MRAKPKWEQVRDAILREEMVAHIQEQLKASLNGYVGRQNMALFRMAVAEQCLHVLKSSGTIPENSNPKVSVDLNGAAIVELELAGDFKDEEHTVVLGIGEKP